MQIHVFEGFQCVSHECYLIMDGVIQVINYEVIKTSLCPGSFVFLLLIMNLSNVFSCFLLFQISLE